MKNLELTELRFFCALQGSFRFRFNFPSVFVPSSGFSFLRFNFLASFALSRDCFDFFASSMFFFASSKVTFVAMCRPTIEPDIPTPMLGIVGTACLVFKLVSASTKMSVPEGSILSKITMSSLFSVITNRLGCPHFRTWKLEPSTQFFVLSE